MTENLHKYAELYRKQGPWCTAYFDAGAGTVDGLEAAEVRPGNIRDALAQQGAQREDLVAMEEATAPAQGQPSPVSRFVLVRQGTVELNELLAGELVAPERITVDVIPDLLPLLKHRPEEFPYIVAEVSREGAEIQLEYLGRTGPADVQAIEGSTEDIHKIPGGGWSHDKLQRRTEQTWRRNADQVAESIDRIVDGSGARLIALAGDIRARTLVKEQISEAHRDLVTFVGAHTHTGGAPAEGLQDEVQERIALQWAAEQQEIMDRLAQEEGQANPQSATGIGAVLHALQQAQVEVLIMNDGALAERRLLALGAEPWIASAGEQALGAQELGRVPAPAALLRAAALTDAKVLLVPDGVLPGGTDVAALLRWPTGPAAPA